MRASSAAVRPFRYGFLMKFLVSTMFFGGAWVAWAVDCDQYCKQCGWWGVTGNKNCEQLYQTVGGVETRLDTCQPLGYVNGGDTMKICNDSGDDFARYIKDDCADACFVAGNGKVIEKNPGGNESKGSNVHRRYTCGTKKS